MLAWLELNALWGISAREWIAALLLAATVYVSMSAIKRFLHRRLEIRAGRFGTAEHAGHPEHAQHRIDAIAWRMIHHTHGLSLLMVSLLCGTLLIDVGDKWAERLASIGFAGMGIQIAIWIQIGVGMWAASRLHHTYNPVITTMMSWLFRVALWFVLLLAVLANVGINITAFVASLGVGGIAIALAVQSILSDVFASAAIGLDKPFEIGDFVVFGEVSGTIEQIGLKTTRIRSLSGEEVICGNTELLKNIIHNYKRMTERRILFTFRLPFATASEKLRDIPALVKAAVAHAGGERTRFDRAHLARLGEHAAEFEVVYYVLDPAYGVYMDIQHEINLTLVEGLDARGVPLAYPTRTVQLAIN